MTCLITSWSRSQTILIYIPTEIPNRRIAGRTLPWYPEPEASQRNQLHLLLPVDCHQTHWYPDQTDHHHVARSSSRRDVCRHPESGTGFAGSFPAVFRGKVAALCRIHACTGNKRIRELALFLLALFLLAAVAILENILPLTLPTILLWAHSDTWRYIKKAL